jgi:hypothetical protein
VTTRIVHFDLELRRLSPEDADAWRTWLTIHQLNGLDLACPSVLEYREPTKKKPAAVVVELLTRDPRGASRSKKSLYFPGSLRPFPARPSHQGAAPRRRSRQGKKQSLSRPVDRRLDARDSGAEQVSGKTRGQHHAQVFARRDQRP